jgi:hypothetical protein
LLYTELGVAINLSETQGKVKKYSGNNKTKPQIGQDISSRRPSFKEKYPQYHGVICISIQDYL